MTKKRRGRQQSLAPGSPESREKRASASFASGKSCGMRWRRILRDGECRDPVLENASITVTEVRMSPDLRNATAFVMPLAGANATEVVAGLERSAAFLKGLVAREVPLRNTPNLVFALDDSFDRADRISALLARPEVARDLQPQAAAEDRDDDG